MAGSPAYTILYLEDEPALAQLVMRGLQKAGLNVHHVNDGQKAIDFLQQSQPDIMLLDLNVPEVSGWQVLKFAKETYGDDTSRVIVATANEDAINRLIGRMNFVYRYIIKPYSMESLLEAIYELMRDEEGAPLPLKASAPTRLTASNDNTKLNPQTSFAKAPALEFDFPGLMIGVAEYDDAPTGCTVFHFPRGASTAIDQRGSAAATIGNYNHNHAICFAGGGAYGLEAASGVAAELFKQRNYDVGPDRLAQVSGAVIYDYHPRTNAIYPDKALGRAALRNARLGWFPLGARGAGRSATVGRGLDASQAESSGQGAAIRQIGLVKVAVFTVVNAIGAIVDRSGQVLRGHYQVNSGQRVHMVDDLAHRITTGQLGTVVPGNTTLTLMVTNLRLTPDELRQVARQVHSSMARAIQPFHTPTDGDIFYAVTTNKAEHPVIDAMALGALASEVAWDAVLSVPAALNAKK